MSIIEVDTNKNIVRLERNSAGMFKPTECSVCFRPTQHRCTFPVLWGKFYDVVSNKLEKLIVTCVLVRQRKSTFANITVKKMMKVRLNIERP